MRKNTSGNLAPIIDILRSIEQLSELANSYNNSFEFYNASDHMLFNNSLSLLVDIGVASKRVSNNIKEDHPEIPWQVMKHFIGVTEKESTLLNREILFDLIKDKLPRISGILEEVILSELGNKNFDTEEYKNYSANNTNFYSELEDSIQD